HWRASRPAGLKMAGSSRPSPHSRSVNVLTPKWMNRASSSRCHPSWDGEGRGGAPRICVGPGRRLPANADVEAAVNSRRFIYGVELRAPRLRDLERARDRETEPQRIPETERLPQDTEEPHRVE